MTEKISPKLMIKNLFPTLNLVLGKFIACLISFYGLGILITQSFYEKIKPIETTFLLTIHQENSPILDQFMLIITTFGNPQILVPVGFITLSLLLQKRAYPEFFIMIIVSLGAVILNLGIKQLIQNPRPQLWVQLITETSSSFPSGHALGCTVIYGMIAYLLSQYYPSQKKLIYSLITIFVICIIFSRLYLGVHWPSDVIFGAIFGLIWLRICIRVLRLKKTPHPSPILPENPKI